MKRLEQVFPSPILQRILPFPHPSTGKSRVPLDQPETLRGGRGFTDPSGPLFSTYLSRAGGQGKLMIGRWKADADGMFIFVSVHIGYLFSCQLGIHRPVCFQVCR